MTRVDLEAVVYKSLGAFIALVAFVLLSGMLYSGGGVVPLLGFWILLATAIFIGYAHEAGLFQEIA